MKFVKGIAVVLLLLVVLVGGVAYWGLKNINELVKYAIETVGPDITQTAVTVDSVDIQLLDGRGEIVGLRIANPKGFDSDYVLDMNKVVLQVKPESLLGGVILIQDITVDGVEITAEQKGLNSNNLQALLNNIQQAGSGTSKASTPAESPSGSTDAAAEEVRLAVEKFTFTNNGIQLIATDIADKSFDQALTIPAIKLSDLGDPKVGLTPSELGEAAIKPLIAQAKSAAEKAVKEYAQDEAEAYAKEKLEKELDGKLNEKQKDQLNSLKGLLGK